MNQQLVNEPGDKQEEASILDHFIVPGSHILLDHVSEADRVKPKDQEPIPSSSLQLGKSHKKGVLATVTFDHIL